MRLGRTVSELVNDLSASELEDWMRYYSTDPWGEWRADYRMGVLAAMLGNIHRKKGANPFKPEDFMPEFGTQTPEAGLAEEIKRAFGVNTEE